MSFTEAGKTIHIELHNFAFHTQAEYIKHVGIISPFNRLYFVKDGFGKLFIENKVLNLEKGFLYLIPNYTLCTYEFMAGLSVYYIHFSSSIYSELNLLDLYHYKAKIKANKISKTLILQLMELHPDCSLPHENPNVYQNKEWINKKISYSSFGHYLETKGIIEFLLAQFIINIEEQKELLVKRIKLKPVFQYIHKNIHNKITLQELADLSFLSKDHFARIFKSITSISPGEYILKKRIEKAQNLLLATRLSQNEIIQATGFNSLSYFSRIFKKYTNKSPAQYRKGT